MLRPITSATVHWTECGHLKGENVEMTPLELRVLLSRIRRSEDKPGQIGYCKVSLTLHIGEKHVGPMRLDVTGDVASIDLDAVLRRRAKALAKATLDSLTAGRLFYTLSCGRSLRSIFDSHDLDNALSNVEDTMDETVLDEDGESEDFTDNACELLGQVCDEVSA